MTSRSVRTANVLVHPGIVRLTHWINAVAILIMIGSGWRIYNNVPIFPAIEFPLWATLGGDPDLTYARNSDVGFSNALLWHLAGMWLFAVNGLVYLAYGIAFRAPLPQAFSDPPARGHGDDRRHASLQARP